MNTALSDSRQAISSAFEENKSALDANQKQTKRALDSSIDIARRDQRAWVGPIEVQPPDQTVDNRRVYVAVGARTNITILVTNSGKTPGTMVSRTSASTQPRGQQFRANYTPPVDVDSLAVILPSQRYTPVVTIPRVDANPWTQPQVDALMAGDLILYAYGIIGYLDVFKIPHYTIFCMFLNRNLTAFSACSTYNHAD